MLPDKIITYHASQGDYDVLLIDRGRSQFPAELHESRKNFIESPHNTSNFDFQGRKIKCDQEIKPTLDWLNQLNGVQTQWSCHGGLKYHSPYVMFTSEYPEITKLILELFYDFQYDEKYKYKYYNNHHGIDTHIEYFDPRKHRINKTPEIRYTARWIDHLALLDFNQFLDDYLKRQAEADQFLEEIQLDNLQQWTENNVANHSRNSEIESLN